MPHFFLAPGSRQGDAVTMTGPLARHVAGALRHRSGDHLLVVDVSGERLRIVVTDADQKRVRGRIVERLGFARSPGPRLTIAQAVLKGSHMDAVFQKATELGVHCIAPIVTRRTVARPPEDRMLRQTERWRAIVLEAAQQSERMTIPQVDDAMSLDTWLHANTTEFPTRLLLSEREPTGSLRDYVDRTTPPEKAVILVGPEGGFEPGEIDEARALGFLPVSLGPFILRAETAGVTALTILQYAWADLGGSCQGASGTHG